ncbi:hypothetical protein U1Q18_011717, partial [Sarracenia purpurea var. burkii]
MCCIVAKLLLKGCYFKYTRSQAFQVWPWLLPLFADLVFCAGSGLHPLNAALAGYISLILLTM